MATVTSYPTAYATSGTISGTRYKNCIGKGSSTTATGNDYSKNSSSTATITYSFDFSAIPENAVIDSVSVKVGGHAESTTYSSSKKCDLQLMSGTTAKGSATHFTSTSKQVLTMDAGTWTRAELQSAKLAVTIGYYGGLVNGVDFVVEYSEAASATRLRIKDGAWKTVQKVYKKQGGSWVEFDPAEIPAGTKFCKKG